MHPISMLHSEVRAALNSPCCVKLYDNMYFCEAAPPDP